MTYKDHSVAAKAVLRAGVALYALAIAGAAVAQDERPLEGETVTVVVGYGPGGGFDTYARLLAPHLAERTGATVVVENRPGAGGNTATNQLMRADADGTVQYLINGVPAVLGQITQGPGITYDLSELTWLARVNAETWAVMVNKDTPYHSLSDMATSSEPITFAALSRADGPSDGAAILCEALQIECRIVLGFDGSSEASLAVLRGEADAIVMTDTTVLANTQGDQARAIGVIGERGSALFPDLDILPDQVELTEDGAFWNAYRGNIADIGRSIVAPPGMDEKTTAYLRGVWADILTDEAIVAEAEGVGRPIDYGPGEDQAMRIEEIFGERSMSRADDIREVLLEKYF